jgi:type I restriction enzyme S subunit
MGLLDTDTTFVTWSDNTSDREDPAFFTPSVLRLEESLAKSGAIELGAAASLSTDRFVPEECESFSYIDIGSIDIRTGGIYATEVDVSDAPSRARWRVSTGDILLSSVRPERGAVGRVPPILDGAVASSGFFVLRPIDDSRQTADALFLFLLTDQFRQQAIRRASSSMYPVINEAQLKTVLVPLHVLEKASPAVSMLRNADSLLTRAAEELDAARQWMSRRLPST